MQDKTNPKLPGSISTVDRDGGESGQVLISLLLMVALFLLAIVGFAVDLTSLWFHRQAAQSAADSACQAGAMDMAALVAGETLPNMGFTPGTAGNCSANSGAGTICFYAKANGYTGAGLSSGASDSVAWSFPTTVSGTTTPPSSIASYPFLRVDITENVPTHFLYSLQGTRYQKLTASSTCGLVQEYEAAPMVVLNPTASGAFTYGGGATVAIVGGPQRSLQVNSNSSTAIAYSPSGLINTSAGGPKGTGSDVAVVGGPQVAPTGGFSGGTTGRWDGSTLPLPDPFASVGPPLTVKSITPTSTTNGTSVQHHQDGCPDPSNPCIEFSPGYYPNGITTNGYQTYTFLPGIYYMGNSLTAGGSATLRMATPCTPTCSTLSSALGQPTDGIMFYFYAGSVKISGCSGCANSDDPVPSTAFTCDGSAPNASIGMPATINSNVLIAQCSANGTYWDSGGDTTDSRGNPGSRGLLVYQDHNDTTQPAFSGSGSLSFAGALYFSSGKSHNYSDQLNLSGGSSSGTFIWARSSRTR